MEKVLSKNWGVEGSRRLSVYRERGGYLALEKALSMDPQAIINEVKAAKLKGRGGAGFPAGVKWGFVPRESKLPKYLCINADEGEPGTFKDRAVIENDPHMLIEGSIITSLAIDIHAAYVYIRGEFKEQAAILQEAIDEAYREGYLGPDVRGSGFALEMTIHRGAGAYICGEETALMESLEGKLGRPRLKPPFPAVVGLFGGPTVINNVETLACVPHIIERGAEWFCSLGSDSDGGPKLYSVSGHVNRPGVYELPSGTNLKEIIFEHCGGIRQDRKLKAVIPGGSSSPVLTADEIDIVMDFASLQKAGSMLGSAGVIVMDETTCMVRTAMQAARFYHHESCGQCTPCREGTGWMARVLARIEGGRGRAEDLDLLSSMPRNIMGNTVCPFGDAAAMPILAFITKFRGEFEEHIERGACPCPPYLVRPVRKN